MCGVAVVVGPGANKQGAVFERMLAAIADRGEVNESRRWPDALLGTARLKIVDRDHAVQPWVSADQTMALAYNGEIFNHGEIRERLARDGVSFSSTSDTEVALASLLHGGVQALREWRAEFALALVEPATGRVFLAREAVGIKPLYWVLSDGLLHIASEVKALVDLGLPIHEVEPGHAGWVEPGTEPRLEPWIDLRALARDGAQITDVDEAKEAVRSTYSAAVRRRVDTDLPVGVVLSGGLDSSLVLLHVAQMHPNCIAFTVGGPGSPDLEYARRLTSDLGIPHVVTKVDPLRIGPREVREAVRVGELTESGDVINAVVSLRLFESIRDTGVKVVLTGDGSDELFGGYDMYADVPPEATVDLFLHKLRHLSRTELQRVDRTSMGRQVEARVPYLDIEMIELALRIPIDLKVRDGYEKWILRESFADLLPDYIKARHKNPMSHSSGLHERVRLFKPLMPRWHRQFGYDLAAPMQRDFSVVLAQHGNDFERARAAAATGGGYTPREQARDLVGALKWNALGLLRR